MSSGVAASRCSCRRRRAAAAGAAAPHARLRDAPSAPVFSALIGNGVASVATPASSQLLGRWSVTRYAPFAFSIAQCAIPAGILLTGYLGPATAQAFGWRDTLLASAAMW